MIVDEGAGGLIRRVAGILAQPKEEWLRIGAEPVDAPRLYGGYVLPLAIASALAGMIGSALVAFLWAGLMAGLAAAAIWAIASIALLFLLVWATSAAITTLAERFQVRRDPAASLKIAAYSVTPVMVAGLAQIVPVVGGLMVVLGLVYAVYVLHLGIAALLNPPSDTASTFTAAVVIAVILAAMIATSLTGCFTGLVVLSVVGLDGFGV